MDCNYDQTSFGATLSAKEKIHILVYSQGELSSFFNCTDTHLGYSSEGSSTPGRDCIETTGVGCDTSSTFFGCTATDW